MIRMTRAILLVAHGSRNNATYDNGTETLARELSAMTDCRVAHAYNEFTEPHVDAAIAALVADGMTHIDVLSTMVTPGGGHAERDIPEALARCRAQHDGVTLSYRWPYDLKLVARLFQRHLA